MKLPRPHPTFLFSLVVLVAAGIAGCLLDGNDEIRDRARLRAMQDEIEALVGVPECSGEASCAYVAFGSKPCGGPWRYLIYSKASTDSALLAEKVEAYNALEERCNVHYGWVSDCMTPTPPRLGCEKGVCVDLNAAD